MRTYGYAAGRAGAVIAALAVTTALSAAGPQGPAGNPAGRWEFSVDAPSPARGGGARAGGQAEAGAGRAAATAPPAPRRITLDLKAGPGNTLTGTLEIANAGRNGAPGNNPLRPVEIADGRVEGNRISFSAWQFDGYMNRVRYEGTVSGDVLKLVITRRTAAGDEKLEVSATRPAY